MAYCQQCGSEINLSWNFCPICNSPIAKTTTKNIQNLEFELHSIKKQLNDTIQIMNNPNAFTVVWGVFMLFIGIVSLGYTFLMDVWIQIALDSDVAMLMLIGSVISSSGLVIGGALIARYDNRGIYFGVGGIIISCIIVFICSVIDTDGLLFAYYGGSVYMLYNICGGFICIGMVMLPLAFSNHGLK